MKIGRQRRFDRTKDVRWRGIMREFSRSGLSIREFCRNKQISEPSFYSWRKTLAARDRRAADDGRNASHAPAEVVNERAVLASVAVVGAGGEYGDWVPAMEIIFGRLQVRIDRCCPPTLVETVLSRVSAAADEVNGAPAC